MKNNIQMVRESQLALIIICIMLFFLALYLLSSEILAVGFIGGASAVALSCFLYFRYKLSFISKENINFVILAKELLLYFLIFIILVLNTLISMEALVQGFSKLGSFVLLLSVFCLVIKKWKVRFLFVFVVLLLGAGLIEINF